MTEEILINLFIVDAVLIASTAFATIKFNVTPWPLIGSIVGYFGLVVIALITNVG
jgi:hypothetical protein